MRKAETLSPRYYTNIEGKFTNSKLGVPFCDSIVFLSFKFTEDYGISEMFKNDHPLIMSIFRENFAFYVANKFSLAQIFLLSNAQFPVFRFLLATDDLKSQTRHEVVDYFKKLRSNTNDTENLLNKYFRLMKETGMEVKQHTTTFEAKSMANFMSDSYLNYAMDEDRLRMEIEKTKDRFKKISSKRMLNEKNNPKEFMCGSDFFVM